MQFPEVQKVCKFWFIYYVCLISVLLFIGNEQRNMELILKSFPEKVSQDMRILVNRHTAVSHLCCSQCNTEYLS